MHGHDISTSPVISVFLSLRLRHCHISMQPSCFSTVSGKHNLLNSAMVIKTTREIPQEITHPAWQYPGLDLKCVSISEQAFNHVQNTGRWKMRKMFFVKDNKKTIKISQSHCQTHVQFDAAGNDSFELCENKVSVWAYNPPFSWAFFNLNYGMFFQPQVTRVWPVVNLLALSNSDMNFCGKMAA